MTRLVILTVALFSVGIAAAHAQQTTWQDLPAAAAAPDSGKPCALCLRGGQKSDCSSFLITEINLLYPLTGGNMSGRDYPIAIGYELGAMINLGRHSAVGATGFAMLDGHDDRAGIKGRFRRWLSPHFASDIGTGVVLTNEAHGKRKWFVGSLGLTWEDRLHFVLEYVHGQADSYQYEYVNGSNRSIATPRRIRKLYAGVKVGGETGAVIGTVGGVVGAIAILIAFQSWGG